MSHDESTALALTPWGASTLDALQGTSEAERAEIARRACEDAITDARGMVSLQGSLFEKLLVIERFGLYRSHVIRDGGEERGCVSIQEFVERAVAPVVQLHKATLYRLKDAVWEAGRLLQQFGTVKADWTNLSVLAGETRRRERGRGVLTQEEYERVSGGVATGAISRRDLVGSLRKRATPRPRPTAVRSGANDCLAPARPLSPLEALERIGAEARRPLRPGFDPKPVEEATARRHVLRWTRANHPASAQASSPRELERLGRLLREVARAASEAAETVRHAEAA
ncbi:MAG: hypothetical protein U0166_20975 [Acidobacteriota bacterium]